MVVSCILPSFQMLLLLFACRGSHTAEMPDQTPPPLPPVSGQLSKVVKSVVIKGESHVEKIEVFNPINLEVECTWAVTQNKQPNVTGYWRKDGNEIDNSRLTVQLENEQYNLKRVFNIAGEESLGNYSCVFDGEEKAYFILAVPHIGDVRDKPIVSYVGDSVVFTCKVEESKPKPNTWNWYRSNGTEKELIDANTEPLRYEVHNEERKTTLKVHNLTMADCGLFHCGAVYNISTSMSHVELKVISFLEPLKPFTAIVVEVIVLVFIILLCEKRNSKSSPVSDNVANADQTDKLTQDEADGMEGSSTTRQRKV